MTNPNQPAELNPQLLQWSAKCSQCLGATFDICKQYYDPSNQILHPLVCFVVAQLGISCHLTSESTFILVSNNKTWDADILLRSVLEGTFKYVYLLDGTYNDQQQKASEYWDTLPRFAMLARHRRAQDLLNAVSGVGIPDWRPIEELLLPDDEAKRISEESNKKERHQMSQKWSFSEMARYFATHPNKKYHGLGCMAYEYGMQSHTIHQDGDGVGMIWDRFQREERRRTSVEIAHAGRIISDICQLGLFRAIELLRACQQKPDPVLELSSKYAELFDSISDAQNIWLGIEYPD